MICLGQDDENCSITASNTPEVRMRERLTTATIVIAISVLLLSSIPVTTEAQTRHARRRSTSPALVPLGTNLRVRLNNTLSSKESRVGDRFTATVVNPSRYDEATISGHIRSITKSGRVEGRTSMTLAFDSIRLRDGRTGNVRADVVRVYDSDSASRVDEEGRVESGG